MRQLQNRRGVAAIFLLCLMIPLLFILAFSIDYGYLLFVKTNLQRAADQAALAGVQDLTPNSYGEQDLEKVRETVEEYVKLNLGDDFDTLETDIELGRYHPETVYSNFQMVDNGIYDTVRITLRRNETANKSVALYFASLFGRSESGVVATATAILQKGRYMGPGTSVFPFAIEQKAWNRLDVGEAAVIYGDGRIEDEFGSKIPGNWGTLDIGSVSNSSQALSEQIRNGLSQDDLDALHRQRRIPNSDWIDGSADIDLNGDTGLSAGLKHALEDVEGQMRIAPIFKKTSGHGGGLEYEIVGWTAVEVVGSEFNGSKNSNVTVRKSFIYDKHLLPVNDLSNEDDVIEGAFTSPVLVQ